METTTANTVVTNDESALRTVLRANAAFSALGGLAGLAGGSVVDGILGTGQVTMVRLVGAGLIVFGIDVAVTASATPERLRQWTPIISAADVTWVVASVGLIVAGVFEPAGIAVVGGIAVAVAAFATMQRRLRSRLVGGS